MLDHRQNPFGLVYEGAITENEPGKVNPHPASYPLNGLTITANVHTPPGYEPGGSFPAIAMAHPNGGIKEQVAGRHAQRLAELATSRSLRTRRTRGPASACPQRRQAVLPHR